MDKLGHERATQPDQPSVTEQSLRRALLITSGWLSCLAERFNLDEQRTHAIVRHEGVVIAAGTLAEALDIANAALAPESQQDSAVTEQVDTTNANLS
jgi:hypothetical protein